MEAQHDYLFQTDEEVRKGISTEKIRSQNATTYKPGSRKERRVRKLSEIAVCIVFSIITSIVVTKILATHYFEIVDGYVEDMCKITKDFINSLLHK